MYQKRFRPQTSYCDSPHCALHSCQGCLWRVQAGFYVSSLASMTPDPTHNTHKHSAAVSHDPRVDQLIARLPRHLKAATRYLICPRSAWMRRAAAILLICGGLLGFLPILGLWMLPVGLLLLAEDVPPLKSATTRILDWVGRRHPDWFTSQR